MGKRKMVAQARGLEGLVVQAARLRREHEMMKKALEQICGARSATELSMVILRTIDLLAEVAK